MRASLLILAILGTLGLAPAPALANCTTDITALKMQVDRERDAARKAAALALYNAALKAEQERNLANCLATVNRAKAKLRKT